MPQRRTRETVERAPAACLFDAMSFFNGMPTVLLVDDEDAVRRALRKILERGGMSVSEAASATEALALLENGPKVDAVVSDVLMPETSGLAFYDQLIQRAPALAGRVIFLTGAAKDPAVHDPIEQRGVPLISKIDDLMLVLDAVRFALLRVKGEK
jgi:two-component system cell cycle sensor histidine kinase/response regulator CckA